MFGSLKSLCPFIKTHVHEGLCNMIFVKGLAQGRRAIALIKGEDHMSPLGGIDSPYVSPTCIVLGNM